MSEKPTAAFILSLISGILVIITALIMFIVASMFGSMTDKFPRMPHLPELIGAWITIIGFVGLIFGILILVGAVMIYSGEPGKVKTGSILVLIFSILSLFTVGGGFFIGFILGLIGGILGLIWKPPVKQESPALGLPQV
ncbi:MAG: DUF4064 domain-containing protein [Desulfurococcaceae archaeon TW002]